MTWLEERTVARLRSPHYVYRAYDADMQLLYVGCTYNPRKRMVEHRNSSDGQWFSRATTIRVTAYPDAIEGFTAEAEAHAAERPAHGYGHTAAGWVRTYLFNRSDVEALRDGASA